MPDKTPDDEVSFLVRKISRNVRDAAVAAARRRGGNLNHEIREFMKRFAAGADSLNIPKKGRKK